MVKPEGIRSLRRHGLRWDGNNKIDFYKITLEGMEWLDLAQDRDKLWPLVNVLMNFKVQWNAGNLLVNCWRNVSFSSRIPWVFCGAPRDKYIYFILLWCLML